jgi:hypothetical protein
MQLLSFSSMTSSASGERRGSVVGVDPAHSPAHVVRDGGQPAPDPDTKAARPVLPGSSRTPQVALSQGPEMGHGGRE